MQAIPVIPRPDTHLIVAEDDTVLCPITPRPFASQLVTDEAAVTCPHCLRIIRYEVPRFPAGTPEYEAYKAELTTELEKFRLGLPPYDGPLF